MTAPNTDSPKEQANDQLAAAEANVADVVPGETTEDVAAKLVHEEDRASGSEEASDVHAGELLGHAADGDPIVAEGTGGAYIDSSASGKVLTPYKPEEEAPAAVTDPTPSSSASLPTTTSPSDGAGSTSSAPAAPSAVAPAPAPTPDHVAVDVPTHIGAQLPAGTTVWQHPDAPHLLVAQVPDVKPATGEPWYRHIVVDVENGWQKLVERVKAIESEVSGKVREIL